MATQFRSVLCAILCLALPSLAMTQDAPGLKIGEKAPKFKLKDQSGKEFSLEEALKKGPAALVFHRSASW